MFAGHFGLAAAVKAKAPQLTLAALFVATQFLDLIFLPLWLLGIETLDKIDDGGYGEQIIHADYTHSLVGALLISILSGYIASKIWKKQAGIIFAFVVMSHWLLDLLVHRMDMPIFPGNFGDLPLLGFGIWRIPLVSKSLEFFLIGLGIIFYGRFVLRNTNSTQTKKARFSSWVASGFVTLLLLLITVMTT